MEAIETINTPEWRISLCYDQDTENPREWDNVGTLALSSSCFGGDLECSSARELCIHLIDALKEYPKVPRSLRKVIADETGHWSHRELHYLFEDDESLWGYIKDYIGDFEDIEDIMDLLGEQFIVLPVYRYEHGQVSYSTASFSCPWDSGQAGFIFAHKGFEGLSDEQIEKNLEGEITDFSAWSNGDVYVYDIEKKVQCEHCHHVEMKPLESVGGFYSSDECMSEAKAALANETSEGEQA